jgi:hypothetical protein
VVEVDGWSAEVTGLAVIQARLRGAARADARA